MGFTLLILFGIFFLLIAMNIPVAISLGISSIIILVMNDLSSLNLFITATFGASDSFPLIAIPLFILAGEIMSTGGIAKRLVVFGEKLLGAFTGGLGIITIFTSFIFAAISGSGAATVAAVGGIMIPYMIKGGYSKPYAAAITASAGALGPIIPPSIIFILYGIMAGVSISGLFIAGIIPGILIAIALIIVNYFITKKEDYPKRQKSTLSEVFKSMYDAKFALLAPIIVLGGIYLGFFTPTEAAVVAVIYSLVISIFVHKELGIKEIKAVFLKSSATSGGILLIIGAGTFFGRVLALEQVPQYLSEVISGITTNTIIMLIILNVVLLLIGMFIDTIAALIIFVPLLLPIVINLGIDPLHFGIIMCVNLSLGLLTPPMGINLFIASKISEISFEKTFKYLVPIFGAMLIVLLIITFIPQLSLYLPSLVE